MFRGNGSFQSEAVYRKKGQSASKQTEGACMKSRDLSLGSKTGTAGVEGLMDEDSVSVFPAG